MKRQSGRIGICTGMALAAACLALALSGRLGAQAPPAAVGFTVAQAERGQPAYAEHCASCHGANLDDGAFAPPLSGLDFRRKWDGQTPEALFTKTSTSMPPARRSLSDDIYADLMATSCAGTACAPAADVHTSASALKARHFPPGRAAAAADSHQAPPFRRTARASRCRKSRRSPRRANPADGE